MLTAVAVKNARPRAKRYELPDAHGFARVIHPTGATAWVQRARLRTGRAIKITFPGTLSLAEARHAASAVRLKLARGQDPRVSRRVSVGSYASGATGIEATIAEFIARHVSKLRPNTAEAYDRIFRREVLPVWRGRSLTDIKRRDVIDLVEDIAGSGRPILANRTLAAVSKLFTWACARDLVEVDPTVGVEKPGIERRRQNVLNDDKLRRLWLAADEGDPYGAALRLKILTGGRRNEVSQLVWSEIDGATWTLPARRSKNRHEHRIPLSRQALRVLASVPRYSGSDVVFTRNGKAPIKDWNSAKLRISKRAGIEPETWRLHDVRRSVASGLQRLKVRSDVIQRALNHRGGSFAGVAGVYLVDRLEDEVREALQLWGDHVEALVSDRKALVRRAG